MGAQYLNTDLELQSESDLSELVSALEGLGLHHLHLGPREGTPWHATLEVDSFESGNQLEPTLLKLLDSIESLPKHCVAAWKGCTLREFDIGFECQEEPFNSEFAIGDEILRRAVDLGISIRITIYRCRDDAPSLS